MHNFGGGRSDLFNSGGRWSKGGRDIFKIQGELAKKGELKIQGGGGGWSLDEAMFFYQATLDSQL